MTINNINYRPSLADYPDIGFGQGVSVYIDSEGNTRKMTYICDFIDWLLMSGNIDIDEIKLIANFNYKNQDIHTIEQQNKFWSILKQFGFED